MARCTLSYAAGEYGTARTVTQGTNALIGRDLKRLVGESRKILEGRGKTGAWPPLWDGLAGERVAEVITANGWAKVRKSRAGAVCATC